MDFDALLEVSCIRCRTINIKGMWQVRAGKCPACHPAYRGSGSIAFLPIQNDAVKHIKELIRQSSLSLLLVT